MKFIRVLVCDDHPLFRQTVRAILDEDPHMRVVGQADNGNEAIRLVKSIKLDVVLMDFNMPHVDGFEATKTVHRDINVLIFHDDEEAVIRSLDAGAPGCNVEPQIS